MSHPLDSIDSMMALHATYGAENIAIKNYQTGVTAATASSGGVSIARLKNSYVVPSLTSGVTAVCMTNFSALGTAVYCGIDTVLGTLTVSGNSFASGSSMPTRAFHNKTAVQTATAFVVLHVSVALTATTPVITVTYTNESGVSSRTATLTLPSNAAIDSCYLMTPHLQSGDKGIQSIQNISTSAGSAGTIIARGVLLTHANPQNATVTADALIPITYQSLPSPYINAGDTLGFYAINAAAATASVYHSFRLEAIT